VLYPFDEDVILSFYSAVSLSSIADAANAIKRLTGVFEAELLEETLVVDENLEWALDVDRASWTWDAPPEQVNDKKKKPMDNRRFSRRGPKANEKPTEKSPEEKAREEEKIFKVRDVSLKIPRGKLVALVGPVGNGKSSLLQGLIGEMRKTSGSVTFGASVSYCPQSAWIQVRLKSSARCCRSRVIERDYSGEHMLRSSIRREEILESYQRFVFGA
jgi:ABC-type multidrug transport system fused ATPase/permease subunit